MRGLQRALRKQNAVVAQYADRHAMDMGEASHQRGAVKLLELVEFRRIDQARDYLAYVVLLLQVHRHQPIELGRGERWLARRMKRNIHRLLAVEIGHDAAVSYTHLR